MSSMNTNDIAQQLDRLRRKRHWAWLLIGSYFIGVAVVDSLAQRDSLTALLAFLGLPLYVYLQSRWASARCPACGKQFFLSPSLWGHPFASRCQNCGRSLLPGDR